ncbi:hypothetical protein FA95DRAFT_1559676 [Auriscalpium vulgare]|uniref:Uncharacterized protein n=1 Tax=Auriscalpium vulgare TaxID=40419 RepID=A0ACB8RS19_9AGAM|nr:hypothetical protein FA95DRAFT_1559676 [Auriscalpium vulgare]
MSGIGLWCAAYFPCLADCSPSSRRTSQLSYDLYTHACSHHHRCVLVRSIATPSRLMVNDVRIVKMAATGRASLPRLVNRCPFRPCLPRSDSKPSAFSRPRLAAELGRHAYTISLVHFYAVLPTLLRRGGVRPTRICIVL